MTTPATAQRFPDAALSALQQGNMIEAIKIVRTERGLGLKESKDVVDDFIRSHPELQQLLSERNAEAKRKLGLWLSILVGGGLIAWFLLR